MLNVSIVWGVIVVSVCKDTQEMETTVQVCSLTVSVSQNICAVHGDLFASLIGMLYIIDIDECATSNECSDHANCNDTDGSYWCECWSGFQGDGYNCTGQSLRIYGKSQC